MLKELVLYKKALFLKIINIKNTIQTTKMNIN